MLILEHAMKQCLRRWRMAAAALVLCPAAEARELEMGAVTVNDTFAVATWTSVAFARPFTVQPLVFALPTNEGSDPATLRIRNVSTFGFEILHTEPNANDGQHVQMTTAYVAVEPGDYLLPDGSRLSAFELSTSAFANRFIAVTWQSVTLPTPFVTTPAVLTQIQTMNNESANPPGTSSIPFMDVSLQNLGPAAFQLTLERAESTAGSVSVTERIGILAITDQTTLSFVDSNGTAVLLQATATANNIVGWSNGCVTNNYPIAFAATPITVASVTSRNGNNGGWVRRCAQSPAGLGLTIDEDIDSDSERSHIAESAGIVAASVPFHANFDVDLTVAKSFLTVSDPVNGSSNQLPIPGAIVEYTIGIENNGSLSPDTDSVTVIDTIPDGLDLCVTTTCFPTGPVALDDSGSPVPPGIAIGLVEYSDDNGVSFTYVLQPDLLGYDPAVNAIRVTLTGVLASISTTGAPSFDLTVATRIR